MNVEIKPCPFCANEELSVEGDTNNGYMVVVCHDCGALVSVHREVLLDKWNTRKYIARTVNVVDDAESHAVKVLKDSEYNGLNVSFEAEKQRMVNAFMAGFECQVKKLILVSKKIRFDN